MWIKIAKANKLASKELLNYYHNTFVKQFFANPQTFKPEINQIIL